MLHFDVVEERMEAMRGVEHHHTSSIRIRWEQTRLMNTYANLIFCTERTAPLCACERGADYLTRFS
jgi:hypothetical protein